MNFRLNKYIFEKSIIILFIVICFFSGILSYLSYIIDNQVIKLWKEIYIIILSLFILSINLKLIKIDIKFFLVFIVTMFFCVEILYSYLLNIPIYIIIYQLKNDFLLLMFATSIYYFLCALEERDIIDFSKTIVKVVILWGTINAIAMILETIFFEQFLSLIGLDMGNWGTSLGVKIITAGSLLRPIGLQGGFVQAATLILICYFIINENRIYKLKFKILRYIINCILIIAIGLSTYATAIIGLLVYFIVKFILKINRLSFTAKRNTLFILGSLLFLFFLYTSHGMGIYEIAYSFYPDKADTSILYRIIAHWQIINEVGENIFTSLFGIGLGFNGVFGLDKESYGILPIATDSAYIYILSNYGFIGVVSYIMLLTYCMIYFYRNDVLGIEYCLMYTLIVEFFFNNTIVNFPINFMLILFICMGVKLKKYHLL